MKATDTVNPKIYRDLFQSSQAGLEVLLELTKLFYDRISYTPGDSHETAFREGQRQVITFILLKLATQTGEYDE